MAASQPGAAAQFPVPSRNNTSDLEYDDTDQAEEEGVSPARNTKLQEHFARGMRGILKSKSHKRVAVLLLSWRKEGEDYLDVEEEV